MKTNFLIFIACHEMAQIRDKHKNFIFIYSNPSPTNFVALPGMTSHVKGCVSPNSAWSELSSMYHALEWYPQLKFIGFFHYRRYLITKNETRFFLEPRTNLRILEKSLFRSLKAKRKTISVARKWHYIDPPQSAYEQFIFHVPELENELNLIGDYFLTKLKWINGPISTRAFLESIDYTYPCNLYVGPTSIIKEYLEFFKDSIVWFESKYDYMKVFDLNHRWIGYISERIFTLYIDFLIKHKKLDVNELNFVRLDLTS